MRKQKVLVLVHKDLVPPKREEADPERMTTADWKTEYDVVTSLEDLGHDVKPLGVLGDLEVIRQALTDFKPNIVFNLLEEFDGNNTFDQHVVSYLELKRVAYTGCNPRGLTLARDKALSKKILRYHRIPVPNFAVYEKNQRIRMKKHLEFPLIVKSLTEESSMGISQASVVKNEESLIERVRFIHERLDTDAIVEQYIEGREFYIGVFGNKRLTPLPVWELSFEKVSNTKKKFATSKVKWNESYREKHGIKSLKAPNLSNDEISKIHDVCKKTYKALGLNGYARIDVRYTSEGKVFILEANPNPGIAYGEEFPDSAEDAGYKYEEIIAKIVSLGLTWYQARK